MNSIFLSYAIAGLVAILCGLKCYKLYKIMIEKKTKHLIFNFIISIFSSGLIIIFTVIIFSPIDGRDATEKVKRKYLQVKIAEYYKINSQLPASLNGFEEKILEKKWLSKFKYINLNKATYQLRTAGKDKKFNTEDDIIVQKTVN